MTSGRLTDKQREIKSNMATLLWLIFRQSGHSEHFKPRKYLSNETIGGIASSMVEDLKKEKTEDVRRAYDSLTRAKR